MTLEGWRAEQRDGGIVYVGPGGEETDWLGHAYDMFKLERGQRLKKGGTLQFVAGLPDKLTPGNLSEVSCGLLSVSSTTGITVAAAHSCET